MLKFSFGYPSLLAMQSVTPITPLFLVEFKSMIAPHVVL